MMHLGVLLLSCEKSSFLPDQNFFFGVTDFCFLFPLD